MYKIEKGIPLPAKHSYQRGTRPRVYPFEDMKVGDSFLVRFGQNSYQRVRRRLHAAARNQARRDGTTYTVRRTGLREIRVWRTN